MPPPSSRCERGESAAEGEEEGSLPEPPAEAAEAELTFAADASAAKELSSELDVLPLEDIRSDL